MWSHRYTTYQVQFFNSGISLRRAEKMICMEGEKNAKKCISFYQRVRCLYNVKFFMLSIKILRKHRFYFNFIPNILIHNKIQNETKCTVCGISFYIKHIRKWATFLCKCWFVLFFLSFILFFFSLSTSFFEFWMSMFWIVCENFLPKNKRMENKMR